MAKVLASCPQGNDAYGLSVFSKHFSKTINPVEDGLSNADALILWGGQDIHPEFYKQKKHPKSGACAQPTQRDLIEWHLMHEAHTRKIPIIGVCRGAQFLCVFAGGSLFQHVTGHLTGHDIATYDGKKVYASANHHQMLDVRNTSYELLAWSDITRSSSYETETLNVSVINLEDEPEVVIFPEVNGLAIQPHPEWMLKDNPFGNWLDEQLELFLNKQEC